MPRCPLQPQQALTLVDAVTDAVFDAAFAWLCHHRRDWLPNADVWRLRQRWPDEKAPLRADLLAGTYQVGLLSRVPLQNGEAVDLWSARDAVVMKALALVLPSHLPLSTRCTHLKGHGGLKYAVRQVLVALPRHRFVWPASPPAGVPGCTARARRLLRRVAKKVL